MIDLPRPMADLSCDPTITPFGPRRRCASRRYLCAAACTPTWRSHEEAAAVAGRAARGELSHGGAGGGRAGNRARPPCHAGPHLRAGNALRRALVRLVR